MVAATECHCESARTLALRAVDVANSGPARAERLAGQAIALAAGDVEPIVIASRALGVAALARGDLAASRSFLQDAVALADASGLDGRAGEARGTLAYALTLAGETSKALELIDRAASAVSGVPAARLIMQRALVLCELGRFDTSREAFADALTRLAAAGGDDLVEADIRTNRSIMFSRIRDWRLAETDLAVAEALYTSLNHVGRTALVAHNRGLTYAAKGDVPAALSAYDLAEARYRQADRSPGLLPVERAETLLSALLLDEARAAAQEAVAEFVRQRNQVDLVQARLLLARSSLLLGDHRVALLEADRARRSAHRQLRPGWAALGAYLSLRARWEGGERSESLLRAGRRTVANLLSAGWVVQAQDARLIVARTALDLGNFSTARRQLARVRQFAANGPAELRVRAWHAEALLRLADDDPTGAQHALESGINVVEEFQASMGATELRVQASGHGGELAALGLTLAVRSGLEVAVLSWSERCRAGSMRLRPVRPPEAHQLSQDLAELRQVVTELNAVDSIADREDLLNQQAKLEVSVRDSSRHAVPDGSAPADGPASVAGLQAALAGRVLVEFVQAEELLYAVALTERDLTLRSLGSSSTADHDLDALNHGLRRLNYQIGSPASLRAANQLVDEKCRRLDDLLVRPLLDDIGGAAMIIVPTGGLHAMPWSILPSCQGRPVSVAPSAHLWQRADTTAAQSDGRVILVSGPGLPHAAAEIIDLTSSYPTAERFTGGRARVDAVTSAMDGAELAHIAAHGHFRTDNPQFSAIDLIDGPLTVYDLEGLRRAPRHVVLSACESGRPAVRAGDEVMGLAAALLALGTRSLIAAVIPVPDDASRPLMLLLHDRLRSGQAPATALAGAQLDLLLSGEGQSRSTAAGFVCFGAG